MCCFSGTWKPQTALEVLKHAQRQVPIAGQSLLVPLCSCVQDFRGAQRFGCHWKSVSVPLLQSAQSWDDAWLPIKQSDCSPDPFLKEYPLGKGGIQFCKQE